MNYFIYREFDREKKEVYNFEVQAIDGGLYGPRSENVRIQIKISDINDNAPVFEKIPYQIQITLNHPVGNPVITVSATDRDSGSNGEVTYRILTDTTFFDIDSKTGVIKTRANLGSSNARVHHLNILAEDNGSPKRSSNGKI